MDEQVRKLMKKGMDVNKDGWMKVECRTDR